MILLAVAPNGAYKTKKDLPNIPLSVEEIGREARACQQSGASMIHLHVRCEDEKHSLDSDLYRQAVREVKEQTVGDLFIQLTSEAVGKYSPDEQFEMIYNLKPQGVSIAIREIKLVDELVINKHFNWMREQQVYPQLILYNEHDFLIYESWLNKGVIPGNAYPLLFVIGKPQKEGAFDESCLESKMALSASSWMICAFGSQEHLVGTHAAQLGGHIRLGFENNHHLVDGYLAKSNAEIIKQMAIHLDEEGKQLASYQDACRIMKPDW